jgi:hypothetical protein
MEPKTKLLLLIAVTCLLGTGCANRGIQVATVAPVERALRLETLDLRNCDSKEEMLTTLASEAPVRKNITISGEAASTATGETIIIPAETQASLEAQIESNYQSEYEQALTTAQRERLTIPVNKIHMYKVQWKQKMFSSTVSFLLNDELCQASYTYSLDIPELTGYFEMSCTA